MAFRRWIKESQVNNDLNYNCNRINSKALSNACDGISDCHCATDEESLEQAQTSQF